MRVDTFLATLATARAGIGTTADRLGTAVDNLAAGLAKDHPMAHHAPDPPLHIGRCLALPIFFVIEKTATGLGAGIDELFPRLARRAVFDNVPFLP